MLQDQWKREEEYERNGETKVHSKQRKKPRTFETQ